jgi:galactokinase
MTTAARLAEKIRAGEYDPLFSSLYGADGGAARQRERYIDALGGFAEFYGASREVSVYSVPGRVELCGNHTDHNNGVVLAAAVNLDIVAVASKSDSGTIRLRSRGFGDEYAVDLARLEPDKSEYGLSSAMIRGVAAGFRERKGILSNGFDAYAVSDVLKGSGLSSSAAFEVCVGTILNAEYNGARFGAVELGLIGQYAENVFFGKPSGLMDQITCAAGGTLSIDLKDPSAPVVKRVPLDLPSSGLSLVVTNTKGDHSNLTDEYAAIRSDMERAASCFGKHCLREVCYDDFLKRVADVRERAGDRAAVRAIHFFEECGRARKAADAAERGDMPRFLELIAESGHSSFEFNQNAYSVKTPDRQGITVGLAVSQAVLRGRGACRLQGGGFAGTIQAFVPEDLTEEYCAALRGVFGDDACYVLRLRAQGGIKII